jgi:hypothetical protein
MQRRSYRRALASIGVLAMVAGLLAAPTAQAAKSKSPVRLLHQTAALRTMSSTSGTIGSDSFQADLAEGKAELDRLRESQEAEDVGNEPGNSLYANGLPSTGSLPVGDGAGSSTFEGLNHFDSRYSGDGNAYSGEPPDQGLCVGNGYAMEIVNSVVQVYSTGGVAQIDGNPYFDGTEPVGLTLNEFYGVDPAITRPAPYTFGLFMFDVSCLYDGAANRWIATSSALSQDATTGAFDGPAYTFVNVSTSGDPLGTWNTYVIDNTNNGTDNGFGVTPDHRCSSGFCFGDYPQTGIDAHGFYVSTNEFDNLGAGEFHGGQLYAFSKADLYAGASAPSMVYLENIMSDTVNDVSYTLQPVNATPDQWDTANGGTMYFGMSVSPFTNSGAAKRMALYALTNTSSLDGTPDLMLSETSVATEKYVVPWYARQQPGPTPLLRCINLGMRCFGEIWNTVQPPHPLDVGSGKVYGAWLHDGVVYLTTSTALRGRGAARLNTQNGAWSGTKQRSGVAYFALEPMDPAGSFSADLVQEGYAAVAGNNLSYPSIAIGPDGVGAIGATLVGPGYYPSAAYIPFTVGEAPTSVEVPSLGVGPSDGFTGVAGYYRPRWGDYGTATVAPDGNVWIAAESIEQSCSFSEFVQDSTCGFTRTLYANWSTRIIEVDTTT